MRLVENAQSGDQPRNTNGRMCVRRMDTVALSAANAYYATLPNKERINGKKGKQK